MPRIRTVKPEHWNDKGLPTISLQAHLLWIATWNFSDDEGIFEADPLLIRSQAFPRRTDIRVDDIIKWLGQLVKARYVLPFNHGNEGYYISRTFKAHQRIDKPTPSKIPVDVIKTVLQEDSKNDRGGLALYSRVEEGKGEEGRAPAEAVADTHPPEVVLRFKNFQEFITTEAPNVAKLKEPFTIDEYLRLFADYPGPTYKKLVLDVIKSMHNKKDLLKKYVSANYTCRAWIALREQNQSPDQKTNNGSKQSTIQELTEQAHAALGKVTD